MKPAPFNGGWGTKYRDMSKATEKALSDLHAVLAETLGKAIKADYFDGEGNKLPCAPAAILNVARQFLKDNGIDAVPKGGTPLGNLANLPVFGEDEGLAPTFKAH